MASWELTMSPHFLNADADDSIMRIDSEADIPVPSLPETATAGSKSGTALVSSLQVGDSIYVAGYVHELKIINTSPGE